ncbi:hypothetical protein SEVIR_8G150700v4 [Setaria viridis]|uniref:Uncharacterized protein n=3 Tax=Setaria TaxID=4554 RepID=A0A368S7L0_SETIT|nr:uncharacterized protein LOC101762535 [Setaria italica]XP_034606818.1 uncharacterized protein LOC117866648 [Setaria viridis]RCV38422.1 hypothetical protein SETIT_8G140900v2 [Setaria italica]TKW01036.1 hypothetical protein SEVIR_8G150700v2 [Setaria viridis]
MAKALLLACHLALSFSLLATSLSHLLVAAVSHLSPSSLHHRLLRLLRHPLLRLLPPLLALPFAFLPLASTPLLPLLLLPPLLPLLPLPFLPPHLPLLRPLLLSLPLLLLARAAGLLAASLPASDLQQHALAVARLLLLAAAAASLASSLSASAPRGTVAAAAHFVAEAGLACAGAVGGLWAAQTGLSLYVDACVPAGCHRLLDAGGATAPATRCEVEEARIRAVAVMDLALSVHCVLVAAVATLVLLGVARWFGVDTSAGTGRRHNGSSYDALPTVASTGAMTEMEHLQGKGIVSKSVAQE